MTGRWGFGDTVMPAGRAIAEIGLSSIIPIAIRVLHGRHPHAARRATAVASFSARPNSRWRAVVIVCHSPPCDFFPGETSSLRRNARRRDESFVLVLVRELNRDAEVQVAQEGGKLELCSNA